MPVSVTLPVFVTVNVYGTTCPAVITDAVALIRQKQPDFDIDKIPLDDVRTFDLLNRGEVIGLFQLDGGMATWCRWETAMPWVAIRA